MPPSYFVHPTALIDQPTHIGEGTRIWHFSHVMKDASIGRNCILGQNCFVASGVEIGNGVKIQNNVSVYSGCIIEDLVFLGPSCVLTNVVHPRAHIERKDQFQTTRIRRGATIGANATIVCGVTVGRYALVGAGAVITRDVPDFGLVYGVPARLVGFVCRCGEQLILLAGRESGWDPALESDSVPVIPSLPGESSTPRDAPAAHSNEISCVCTDCGRMYRFQDGLLQENQSSDD